MEILVNDQPYQAAGPVDQTVQDLANEVCGAATGRDQQLITQLRCDGTEIAPDSLEEILQQPISAFERLELQTTSLRSQLCTALSDAIDIFSRSNQLREKSADYLTQGDQESAMKCLQQLLEVWKQIQQTTILAAQFLEVNVESLQVQGRGVDAILGDIRTQLVSLKTAMEDRDFVLVCDMLRYEFDEPLQQWQAILTHLRNLAE